MNKTHSTFTPEQRVEYAKLMVEDNYSSQQVMELSGAGSTAIVRWKRQYLFDMPVTSYYYKPIVHSSEVDTLTKMQMIHKDNLQSYGRRRMKSELSFINHTAVVRAKD